MSYPEQDADLVALALVRQAITYSDALSPSGDVGEVMVPYLDAEWERAGSPADGFDAGPALRKVIASLAQVAGACYSSLLSARLGREPSKQEVLANLDELEHAMLADPEQDQ